MANLNSIADRLRSSLWFIPGLCAVGAFVGAALALTIDRTVGSHSVGFFLFGGTAEAARSVLSTIATSMLTFTGLVFTITMLVLQLASSQLSPRVTRTFLRDRQNQAVLGLFVATFLYTLLLLRDVRSGDGGPEFVPGFSIWLAFLLLVASVAAFVYYIDHMAHSIRATAVIDNLASETRSAIDRLYPDELGDERRRQREVPLPEAGRVIPATSSAVLVSVDEERLLDIATRNDVVVELVPQVGDFVIDGTALFRLRSEMTVGNGDHGDLADKVRSAITLARERTLQQDAAFGFRLLVDVAIRALSPGTNDPTTAVQVIDRIHELLRRLCQREFPPAVRLDDRGEPRLIVPGPAWEDYVRLAVDEIRLSGSVQIEVLRRLRLMLEEIMNTAREDRASVLRDKLGQLDKTISRSFDSDRDRQLAGMPAGRGETPQGGVGR